MKLLPSVKTIVGYSVVLALTGGLAYATTPSDAPFDPTQLETTVAQHTDELANHEQRITTLENASPTPATNSAESPQAVAATVAGSTGTAESPAPTPAPTPRTTKTVTNINTTAVVTGPFAGSGIQCIYTFDDGSQLEEPHIPTTQNNCRLAVGDVVPIGELPVTNNVPVN